MSDELALHGVRAAPGVSVGRAVVLDRIGTYPAVTVSLTERVEEAARARRALEAAASELERIAEELRLERRGDEADIVETGVLMAMDPDLTSQAATLITTPRSPP